ncbi:hypothetical protein DQ04_02611020 [Trypanosoma grayi]|uniref:hypothetical protein n=1 Tax=Trypanosoma grayi TaxID=71804 RepID=UPI0004F47235|nr:hypothetical protein DQ04_02611020 [Trypanosoma grayi]KEG11443.1 hypothetical protein DQ04_02611020 [Trypanosoma grayi]
MRNMVADLYLIWVGVSRAHKQQQKIAMCNSFFTIVLGAGKGIRVSLQTGVNAILNTHLFCKRQWHLGDCYEQFGFDLWPFFFVYLAASCHHNARTYTNKQIKVRKMCWGKGRERDFPPHEMNVEE